MLESEQDLEKMAFARAADEHTQVWFPDRHFVEVFGVGDIA